MTSAIALDRFLAHVEKQAFRMARYATRNDDAALDIVQDAMLTLATKYASRPETEWRPLFFRILTNRITDWHRRGRSWRRLFFSPVAADHDPRELVTTSAADEPEHRARVDGASQALSDAIEALPPRQQQAFLLRALEGLDVAETARAMRCSAGSVKTHYHRAVQALRGVLEDHWE